MDSFHFGTGAFRDHFFSYTHEAGEFELETLPTDILEGVMQRVRDRSTNFKGKGFMERVNQRFATVAHRLAWRHHHTLKLQVDYMSCSNSRVIVGPFYIDWVDAAPAARFLIARSTIRHVEFDVDGCEILKIRYHGQPMPVEPGQEHFRTIFAGLLSSDRLALRSLVLHRTADELFGGSDQLAALIRRHSATLQDAGLFFRGDEPPVQVGDALSSCPGLRKLTAFVDDLRDGDPPSWQRPLEQLVRRLQLSKLTFSGSPSLTAAPLAAIAAVLPTAPKLTELRFKRIGSEFDQALDWSPLAEIRLFEADVWNLCLMDDSEQAETKRVFSAILPNLSMLVINRCSCNDVTIYWGSLTKLVGAFLNRAGEASLAVEQAVFGGDDREAWRRPLTDWQAAFPELSIEYFGADHDDGEAAATRPVLPKEFDHAAVSEVFILGRPNEARRITIAVWQWQFPPDDCYFD